MTSGDWELQVTWFRILLCFSNPFFFKGLHQILWLPFNKFWFRRYVILPSSFIPSYWTTVLLSKKVQNLFFKAKNYSITHHCVYLQWIFLKINGLWRLKDLQKTLFLLKTKFLSIIVLLKEILPSTTTYKLGVALFWNEPHPLKI